MITLLILNIEKINNIIKKNACHSLKYEIDPIVSSDIVGSNYGAIFDSLLTQEISVNNKKLFKIIIWYDNEMSYVSQYLRTLKYFVSK